MRRALGWLAVLSLWGCTKGPGPDSDHELLVFAGASLRDALTAVARDFEREPPTTTVYFSFAGSNALARQLMAAPRADVFVSASEAWMDRVERAGVIEPGSRRALLGNQLVVVVNRDVNLRLGHVCDLLDADLDHLALGDPGAVPAGVYAREYLEGIDCPGGRNAWASLNSKVIPTPDVRAALAQAEASRSVAAFVYRTDAAVSSRVRVALTIGTMEGPRIVLPVALVRGHTGRTAQRFLAHLESPVAARVFEQHGFVAFEPDTARTNTTLAQAPTTSASH